MDISSDNSDLKSINAALNRLDQRISVIEEYLHISEKKPADKTDDDLFPSLGTKERYGSSALDLQLGEYWFPKVGIVILAVGILLLLTLSYKGLPTYMPALFGYFISALLFIISNRLIKNYNEVSRYLFGVVQILLYFSTLRLHYFGEAGTIESKILLVVLLTVIVIFNSVISIRRNSLFLTGINISLAYLTFLLSGNNYIILFGITLLASFAVFLKYKFGWHGLLTLSILLAYISYFLMLINNPIAGNNLAFLNEPSIAAVFPVLYLLLFTSGLYAKDFGQEENFDFTAPVFLNLFLSYGLLSASVFSLKLPLPFVYHYAAALLFLTISMLFWKKYSSKYAAFLYAMFGYGALSVGIILNFEMPDFFIVLCWQSLIVVSTAIVFRSKIIIITNFFIFLMIFFAFLFLSGEVSLISISFAIVALVTARILNWKKDELDLKTELMRNAYLATAFFIIPYALYNSIPRDYLIISLVGVTAVYYILGQVLKNMKYRLMGHLNLILTVLYTVIIGTVALPPELRVLSFIITGIALIAVSLVYTRSKIKGYSKETNGNQKQN